MTTIIRQQTDEEIQRLLEECYRGVPETHLTPAEVDDLARQYAQLDHEDRCEGRVMRPFRRVAND